MFASGAQNPMLARINTFPFSNRLHELALQAALWGDKQNERKAGESVGQFTAPLNGRPARK